VGVAVAVVLGVASSKIDLAADCNKLKAGERKRWPFRLLLWL